MFLDNGEGGGKCFGQFSQKPHSTHQFSSEVLENENKTSTLRQSSGGTVTLHGTKGGIGNGTVNGTGTIGPCPCLGPV